MRHLRIFDRRLLTVTVLILLSTTACSLLNKNPILNQSMGQPILNQSLGQVPVPSNTTFNTIHNNTLPFGIHPTFLWGAATASYQAEGGITNNDWDFFTRSQPIRDRVAYMTSFLPFTLAYKGPRIELQPARDAVKFWDPSYYEKYFDDAKTLGMNSLRIGIEWSRIEPQKDVWDQDALNHYKQMIVSMKQKGLTPVVTLNHFTLPLWVLTPPTTIHISTPPNEPLPSDPYRQSLGGWENPQTVEEFTKYVSVVTNALKDDVDFWLTVNEPVGSYIGVGYLAGIWSPGFIGDAARAKVVLHNLIEAHVRAYDAITAIDNIDADGDGVAKSVGFAHAMLSVTPAKPIFEPLEDNLKAASNFDYFINDYFLNAVVNGEEDLNYLDSLEIHNTNSPKFITHDDWKNKLDFVGLNYYRRVYVYHDNALALSPARFIGGRFDDGNDQNGQTHGLLNDLGWEIYPQGMHDILMKIKNQWDKPILITENGIPDQYDRYRAPFIVAHIEQVKKAMDEGANVLGYLYWSLTDNFEWAYNYKPETKFGLFSIDLTGRDFVSDTKSHSSVGLGGRGDDIINEGVSLPSSNCVIDDVILELLNKDGTIIATTNKGQPDAKSPPLLHLIPVGARIVASNEGTANEQVQVHWFFEGLAGVKYRLHYYLSGEDCNGDGNPDFIPRITKGGQIMEYIVDQSNGGPVTQSTLQEASKVFGVFTADGNKIVPEIEVSPPSPPPPLSQMSVQVQPQVLPEQQPTQIIVTAKNSVTNAPVNGKVFLDGVEVGTTNVPFNHVFQVTHITQRIFDEESGRLVPTPVTVIHGATGKVVADGYSDVDISFPGRTIGAD